MSWSNSSLLEGLNLGESAIDEQFRTGDVARVVGGEEHHGFGDLSGVPSLPSGTALAIIFLALLARPPTRRAVRSSPGVSVDPGLTALTRMRRAFRSVVQVRAKERTAALVAL